MIPLQREDLSKLPEEDPAQIWVETVYSLREIASKVKEAEAAERRRGCDFVEAEGSLETLYSVLALFHRDLHPDCKSAALALLQRALTSLEKGLDRALGQGNKGNTPRA